MPRKNDLAINRVVVATGVSSVVTQLLVIREFLALFRGNEFVIALILFNWLILGSIGTRLARAVADSLPLSRKVLAWISLLLAVFAGAQFLLIRELRDLVFTHGTSVGFYHTFIYTVLTIAPYCLLLGFALPYSLYLIRKEMPDYSGARVYMADNLGDASGGALFTFVLVTFATPFQALLLSSLPLLLATIFLFQSTKRRVLYSFMCLAGLLLLILLVKFEPSSLVPSEGELVHYQESRYGRIEIHKDREQFTLFADGVPVFSNQNLSRAEEAVHYPLSQLDQVGRVLLVSSEGGIFQELQKYRPEAIDYLELDPEMSAVQFRFGLIREMAGLEVIHQDGREWLSETRRKYDAIIMSLPEPETYQVNRFFTDEFFALALMHLKPGGILSFSMQGYDNYLAEPQRQKLSLVYETVKNSFPHVLLLPGDSIYFLCSSTPLSRDIPSLLDRKGIATRYISAYYYGNLTDERIDYLADQLLETGALNRDLDPRLMRMMFGQWFSKFQDSPLVFFAVLGVLLILYLAWCRKEEFVLFSTGFMTMGCEILVIFAFQIYYGYIYSQIGLIVTVFLVGLLPGAWYGDRSIRNPARLLVMLDALLVAAVLLFGLALAITDERMPVYGMMIFGFAVSFICGCQFPAALKMGGGGSGAVSRTFSADLIGAACGTLLTSVALIPYLGILQTIAILAGLKMMSLLVVMQNAK
ncbi:MAG: hypothetical protein KKG47_01385 [Proteobacteria bacterium]|nr:hypothetical protein [Pseudomonadota bacterium]MBU1736719.1 hypothetical protein [Pseudomonadota bacterium]